MQILQNIWIQTIGVPIFLVLIAQGVYLLANRARISADDFTALPYSLVAISVAINASFSISKPANIAASSTVYLILFFVMIIVGTVQKYVPWSTRISNSVTTVLGMFVISATFLVWR